jgi:hypothetical protein
MPCIISATICVYLLIDSWARYRTSRLYRPLLVWRSELDRRGWRCAQQALRH